MFFDQLPARWRHSPGLRSKAWSKALHQAVLTSSDVQVVTGIAILVSAYDQIPCGLQYYHWQIAVDLALFSSITHLTTLTCLRDYFRTRRALASCRLALMIIIGLLLIVALGSTGYSLNPSVPSDPSYPSNGAIPAWCLYQSDVLWSPEGAAPGYDWLYIVILVGYLIFSYLSRAIQISPWLTDWIRTNISTRPADVCIKRLDRLSARAFSSGKLSRVFIHNLLLSLYCVLKATADLYNSILFEVWVVILLKSPQNAANELYRSRGWQYYWCGEPLPYFSIVVHSAKRFPLIISGDLHRSLVFFYLPCQYSL